MKIAQSERTIDRVSIQTERTFSIKATGKAFRILSSGLYKEKVLAIIRELSCNAYDSHIAAGYPEKPFDVHLPNSIEPFFSVRDYGVGLSPEDIQTIYTTYFESTKTDSNDFIGALGLGSKSPFSYVDSFTVISRYQGMKRSYTAYIAEDDMPSLAPMAEEPTDEGNGLEVIIPVTSNSIWEFKDRAARVYQFFNPCPNISGDANFKHTPRDPMLQGNGWSLVNSGNQPMALMGMVGYPIDSRQIVDQQIQTLLHLPLDIKFDIGLLDVTAGREELSYDKRTIAAIGERLKEVKQEIPRRLFKAFKQCKTLFEALRLYDQLFSKCPGLNFFPNHAVPYRGKLITSSTFSIDFENDYDKDMVTYYFPHTGWSRSVASYTEYSGVRSKQVRFPAVNELKIFHDDLDGRGMIARVRRYKELNRNHLVLVVRCKDALEVAKLKQDFEGVEFLPLSTLEMPQSEPRTPTMVRMLDEYAKKDGNLGRDYFSTTTVDPSEGGLFVRTVSSVIMKEDGSSKDENFPILFRHAKTLGFFDAEKDELYAIPKTLGHKFKEDDGWIDFHKAIREQFIAAIKPEWGTAIAKSQKFESFRSKYGTINGEKNLLRTMAGQLSADHELNVFIKRIFDYEASAEYAVQNEMAKILEIEIPIPPIPSLSDTWKVLNDRYPLIYYTVRSSYWDRKDDDLIRSLKKYVIETDAGREKLNSSSGE